MLIMTMMAMGSGWGYIVSTKETQQTRVYITQDLDPAPELVLRGHANSNATTVPSADKMMPRSGPASMAEREVIALERPQQRALADIGVR